MDFKKLSQFKHWVSKISLGVLLTVISQLSLAQLPPAPPEPSGKKGDWLGNLLGWGQQSGKIFLIGLGAATLSIVAWGIVQAFSRAQEEGSWGKFGVTLVGGLICATVSCFLIKYGWMDLSTSIT